MAAMLSACCLSLVLAQGAPPPAPAQPPPQAGKEEQTAVAAAAAPVKPATDAEAKAALAEFKKVNPKKVGLADRLAAVDRLGDTAHKLVVPALAKVALTEASLAVRKRAAELLARQPRAEAGRAAVGLLQNEGVQRTPELLAAVVGSLAVVDCPADTWPKLEELFEEGFEGERVPLQRAILGFAAARKEKRALRLLLKHLPEPTSDPNDRANTMPDSYWEARWKAWHAWREDVKGALRAITGQQFGTPEEARAWLDKHGAKLGLKD
jgi:hypothetical protein